VLLSAVSHHFFNFYNVLLIDRSMLMMCRLYCTSN